MRTVEELLGQRDVWRLCHGEKRLAGREITGQGWAQLGRLRSGNMAVMCEGR
jgi:hypothetical protein